MHITHMYMYIYIYIIHILYSTRFSKQQTPGSFGTGQLGTSTALDRGQGCGAAAQRHQERAQQESSGD